MTKTQEVQEASGSAEKKSSAESAAVKSNTDTGFLVSRLNRPVQIEYDGDHTMINPKERVKVIRSKVKTDSLPDGVQLI